MSHDHTLPPGHFAHFEPEQAYHSAKMGMWLFLATELHLFSGLFCVFAYYRWKFLEAFNEGAHSLNWKLGALNTAVLLTSSYTMVRAVDAAQKGDNKRVVSWVNWTVFLGFGFFIVKGLEYSAKLLQHNPPIVPNTHVFYGIYYAMTGLHAIHVAVGIGALLWIRGLAKKGTYSTTFYTPVEVTGLYWHLVDIIWIYLFPVLYLLAGVHA